MIRRSRPYSEERAEDAASQLPKGRVFIPQEPKKMDVDTGVMRSIMNFNQARRFGEPVVLCPTGPAALNTIPVIWELKNKLKDFNDEDYLIAVGDPTLQAMAAVVAAFANRGRVAFLKWDKELKQYFVVKYNYYAKLGSED